TLLPYTTLFRSEAGATRSHSSHLTLCNEIRIANSICTYIQAIVSYGKELEGNNQRRRLQEENTNEKNNRSNINCRNRQFGLSGYSDGRRRKRGDRSDVEPARGGADDNQR